VAAVAKRIAVDVICNKESQRQGETHGLREPERLRPASCNDARLVEHEMKWHLY
jgi:hypothetical protein